MKYFSSIIIIFLSVMLCGFSFGGEKNKPYVRLNSASNLYTGTPAYSERRFASGSRVYYTLFAPKGFKDAGIRYKIIKWDDKTSNWGLTIVRSGDFFVNLAQNTYKGYFVLTQSGHYITEFYYLNNINYPFARNEFWID